MLRKSWKLVLMGVGCIILVILILDFNNRMGELRRLSAEKERVGAQVTSLVETQSYLETQVAYATSEAAVYKWAYEFQRMAKSGDKLVVPIQPGDATVVPTPQPTATPQVIQNWQVWLSLFTDQ